MLTLQHKKVVQNTYFYLITNDDGSVMNDKEIATLVVIPFYNELFRLDPKLAQYFNHLSQVSCDFARVFTDLIRSLFNEDLAKPIIALAKRHVGYAGTHHFEITKKNFADVGSALVTTILSTLKEFNYPMAEGEILITNSWVEVYNAIVDIMKTELKNVYSDGASVSK